MSEINFLNKRQTAVAQALIEWRDAGGPVENVVLSIQQMVIGDMKYVLTPEKKNPDD